jgi:hypothetical protein
MIAHTQDYIPNQNLPGLEHRRKDEKSIDRYKKSGKEKTGC